MNHAQNMDDAFQQIYATFTALGDMPHEEQFDARLHAEGICSDCLLTFVELKYRPILNRLITARIFQGIDASPTQIGTEGFIVGVLLGAYLANQDGDPSPEFTCTCDNRQPAEDAGGTYCANCGKEIA